MKPRLPSIDRRTLLIGGGVGFGLVVAFAVWPRADRGPLLRGEGEQLFGPFVKVAADGQVTVAVPQTEFGQGAWTALPQIVADELGAAWETVSVEPAPLEPVYANPLAADEGWLDGAGAIGRQRLKGMMRITAGSTSVRAFEAPLRHAGAVARALLCAAAAERWQVSAAECDTADGFVVHSGRRLPFGEVAERAAELPAPDQPPLRAGKLLGRPLPRLDLPAKSDGSFRFAGDVRLPDMLFASARLAPPRGRLAGYARDRARSLPGVRAVVARRTWLAVVADSWWAAEQGVRAARASFEGREGLSREGLRAILDEALESGDSQSWFRSGDYEAAVEGRRPLAATYWVAPAQHMGLEPLTATARFADDRLELWLPTQAPEFARTAAADAAGIDVSRVTLYPMPVGDSGGRALEADLAPLVVELARRSRRPVQLTIPQHSSQNQDRVSTPALIRTIALPSDAGIPAAWKMRVATADGLASALARMTGNEPRDELGRGALDGAVPPYAITDMRVDAVAAPLRLASGYLRGHPQRAMTFAIESFIDELARRAGLEPLAYRMAMLGSNPRLARCISTAAALGGWDGGGQGSTMGLAAASVCGSHIGLLANATLGADQRIAVHRLVAVVDCGRIVNPQLVRQQVESGLIWGLATATVREPEWVAGMPRSRPLGALGLPRIAGAPEVVVELVASNAPPGGVSGLAVPVLAPAISNAIAAGTGRRLRELPFDPMAVAA